MNEKGLTGFVLNHPGSILVINLLSTACIGGVLLLFKENMGIEFSDGISLLISLLYSASFSLTHLALTVHGAQTNIADIKDMVKVKSLDDRKFLDKKLQLELNNLTDSAIKSVSFFNGNGESQSIEKMFIEEIYKTLSSCRGSLDHLHSGVIRDILSETKILWTNIIRNTNHSFCTTNYGDYEGSFGRASDELINNMYKEKIQALKKKYGPDHCPLLRIFIHDQEIDGKLGKIMLDQANVGLQVYSIDQQLYDKLGKQNSWVLRIGSPDFAIIDEKFILVTHIQDKEVTHSELSCDQSRIEVARNFLNVLKQESEPFKSDEST